jgi:hypothetical protein
VKLLFAKSSLMERVREYARGQDFFVSRLKLEITQIKDVLTGFGFLASHMFLSAKPL